MMLQIPGVLTPEEAASFQRELEAADWIDGRGTAGHLSHGVKRNGQLHFTNPLARRLGDAILQRLERNGLFVSAALPHSILPPLFNRYEGGEHYGPHVDGAIRPVDGTPHRIRTDLSATLFLTPPEDYDGGELHVRDALGVRSVKLPAGDMVLYPGTTLHEVTPVTRGTRIAAFFWVQSLVRSGEDRSLLFELDAAIQQLSRVADAERASVLQLTNVYHNLLRRWAEI